MTMPPKPKSEPIHGGAVAAILKLISSKHLMTLAVNRPDGRPHAATLGYVNDGLNLYFITSKDSEKLANLTADPRVGVAIRGRADEGEAVGVAIDGRAQIVSDQSEIDRLFKTILEKAPEIRPWAPGPGQSVVVKVIPESIEAVAVIEGQSRAQTYAIGDADAAVQGIPYEPSAVAKLF
ncbi:MAG: pyridoxamine 5'-phosphate oxidase family protein [Janthinobacterium lividum]